jgi:hypothetical protein
MKKGVVIKKGILIAISVIAAAGVGYFIYQKIADRNKEIIKEGTFTIRIDETASTGVPNQEEFVENYDYENNDTGYSYDYDYGYDYGEAAWTYIYDEY